MNEYIMAHKQKLPHKIVRVRSVKEPNRVIISHMTFAVDWALKANDLSIYLPLSICLFTTEIYFFLIDLRYSTSTYTPTVLCKRPEVLQ